MGSDVQAFLWDNSWQEVELQLPCRCMCVNIMDAHACFCVHKRFWQHSVCPFTVWVRFCRCVALNAVIVGFSLLCSLDLGMWANCKCTQVLQLKPLKARVSSFKVTTRADSAAGITYTSLSHRKDGSCSQLRGLTNDNRAPCFNLPVNKSDIFKVFFLRVSGALGWSLCYTSKPPWAKSLTKGFNNGRVYPQVALQLECSAPSPHSKVSLSQSLNSRLLLMAGHTRPAPCKYLSDITECWICSPLIILHVLRWKIPRSPDHHGTAQPSRLDLMSAVNVSAIEFITSNKAAKCPAAFGVIAVDICKDTWAHVHPPLLHQKRWFLKGDLPTFPAVFWKPQNENSTHRET